MHKRENSFMFNDYRFPAKVWEFPIGPVDPWDEAFADDRELFPPVHIHWSEESRDCDGGHGDYGIFWPGDNHRNDDGSVNAHSFWTAEIKFATNAHALAGRLTVTSDPYESYSERAEWSETTEEGYRHREIYVCIGECDEPTNTVYDQFAQEAGY